MADTRKNRLDSRYSLAETGRKLRAKFIEKGSKVLIVGRTGEPINIFEKKDGTAGANYEVTAQTVEFFGQQAARLSHLRIDNRRKPLSHN